MASYSRLPKVPEGTDEKLAEVRTLVTDGARKLGGGLATAATAFGNAGASELEGMLGDADLPELSGDDAIQSLALRLDREADLWRSVALREQAKVAWTDRVVLVAAAAAGLTDLVLAAIGGTTALFGAEGAVNRAVLLVAAGVVATGGAAIVAAVASTNRKTQRAAVADAFARGDVAELRLHRLGVTLAIRQNDPAAYGAALERLERDAAG